MKSIIKSLAELPDKKFIINGYEVISLGNSVYNLINKEGQLLFDEWYINLFSFDNDNKAALIRKDFGPNSESRFLINVVSLETGKILSDQWFEFAQDFKEGFAAVTVEGKGY